MLHLLYSADYELYLGANLRPEPEILIQPTSRLLERADDLGIPVTLFADVACLWRYREWGEAAFPAAAEAQWVDALRRGHDIQLHLHPHWLVTSRGEGGSLRFDPAWFLLGNHSPDPDEVFHYAAGLLKRGRNYLEGLLNNGSNGYECRAFRAGGYGLQPAAGAILRAQLAAGVHIDSSIIPGFVHRSATHAVDFSRVARAANPRLTPEGGLGRDGGPGGILEIPIGAALLPQEILARTHLWDALTRGWAILTDSGRRRAPRGRSLFGDQEPGAASQTAPPRWRRAYWRIWNRLHTRFVRLELTAHPPGALLAALEEYLKPFDWHRDEVFVSLNCHPKGLEQRHLRALARFHRGLRRRYGGYLNTPTFGEVARRVGPPVNSPSGGSAPVPP